MYFLSRAAGLINEHDVISSCQNVLTESYLVRDRKRAKYDEKLNTLEDLIGNCLTESMHEYFHVLCGSNIDYNMQSTTAYPHIESANDCKS